MRNDPRVHFGNAGRGVGDEREGGGVLCLALVHGLEGNRCGVVIGGGVFEDSCPNLRLGFPLLDPVVEAQKGKRKEGDPRA